jgi:putative ATP-dependent endonuclease of OLD family
MKLVKVVVNNYRSLFEDPETGPFSVELGDGMNALIGPNNCGKSNVLRAIALALDESYPFDRDLDKPAGWAWTRVRVTLDFRCDAKRSGDRTMLKRAKAYEESAGVVNHTYAADGVVRLTVVFEGDASEGARRREYLYARGAGNRIGDLKLLERALAQIHREVRFVLIQSGQSLESVLAGKFREILHTVIRDHLRNLFEAADRRRSGYVEGLQGDLLNPLRLQILRVVADLFPEVTNVTLIPHVSSIDETLSNVEVNITDAMETALAAKGTGLRGAVLVAMLRYLADQTRRSMVFAVEEPEAFLHPAAQEALKDDLEALAKREEVTLLATTHSPFVVSRAPSARVIALSKDDKGRTRLAGQAAGNQPHASLLGGLFRDAALPDMLDRSAQIPVSARGIVVVEGLTDEAFLRMAVSKLKRPDLLADIHVSPSGGARKTVVQSVLYKQQTPKPIVVLLDSDEMGRVSKDDLHGRFGFSNSEILTYAAVAGDYPGGTEAEDMFPPALLDKFVAAHGEERVVKVKSARKSGGWRYDFNETGKEVLPEFITSTATATDFELWLRLLHEIRKRLHLSDDQASTPPASARTRVVIRRRQPQAGA